MSVWEMLFNGKFPLKDTSTCKWDRGASGYALNIIFPASSGGGKGGGTGGGGWNWLGLYNPVTTYAQNDVVQLGSGTAAGMYLSIISPNTNSPDSGIGWVQISTSVGTWL
jgi:hypothetical protein